MRLNDTTRAYFERLATISVPEQAERYRNIVNPSRRAEIENYFAKYELGHNSILRTSISPTMMKAGFRTNVIPSEADAYLDIRALPDEDMEKFAAELRRVIADPKVDVILPREMGRPASPPSRADTEMFRALEKAQRHMYPGAITLPAMLTGATDMAQLRAKGVQAYGFGPVTEGEGGLEGGPHADDERLAEDSMVQLVEFLWRAVMEIAVSR
jgi:acetylornithine deacetylase/succinyl-diaminopimelate desuccinylase-like protein